MSVIEIDRYINKIYVYLHNIPPSAFLAICCWCTILTIVLIARHCCKSYTRKAKAVRMLDRAIMVRDCLNIYMSIK